MMITLKQKVVFQGRDWGIGEKIQEGKKLLEPN